MRPSSPCELGNEHEQRECSLASEDDLTASSPCELGNEHEQRECSLASEIHMRPSSQMVINKLT